ncbi:hypothetical protein PVAND_016349 [Polypedilum vanderplanki]|uniref:Uncharacterized protein n=1 Tax=Polypedilum vanderplanki TaxID=319348 RepID=A0A9J6BEV0_POLVA|nr:hypothetical protein PVAND_016349 [Polypedilum vanderplanki]
MFQTICETFQNFGVDTSIHGVTFITGRNRNFFNRIIWSIALLFSSSFLIYNIYFSYNKWQNAPPIVIRNNVRNLKEIPMPALTICSPLFVKENLTSYWEILEIFYKNRSSSLTTNDLKPFVAKLHACDYIDKTVLENLPNLTDINIVQLLNQSSYKPTDFSLYCIYNDSNLDCSKTFNKILTNEGFCYSLNMQDFDVIFNAEKISEDFYSYKNNLKKTNKLYNSKKNFFKNEKEKVQWTLEKGYIKIPHENSIPMTAFRNRKEGTLLHFQKINKNNSCDKKNLYFRYYLHLPNEIPSPLHHKNVLKFNIAETITLKAKMYKTDESLRKYSPEIRGCYFEGEKNLKFFKSYTKANCEFECMANQTFETCGCVKFSMPRDNETKVCDETKIKCYTDVMTFFRNNQEKAQPCDCLRTCSDIKYSTTYSDISSFENNNDTYALAHLFFRFEEYFIEEEEIYTPYTILIFIAETGGLMGLFLGCSILSIMEIFYFFILLFVKVFTIFIFSYFKKNQIQNQENVIQIRPKSVYNQQNTNQEKIGKLEKEIQVINQKLTIIIQMTNENKEKLEKLQSDNFLL